MPAYLKKPIPFLLIPWRKYNEFFDNGCWGIWGLSPLLKYTLLYLAAFFIPAIFGWVKLGQDTTTTFSYIGFFIIGALFIALIWFVYLPILCILVLIKLTKNIRLLIGKLVNLWSSEPKSELVKEGTIESVALNQLNDIHSNTYRFFYKLTLHKKPNPKNAKPSENIVWLIKFYTGYCFILLISKYTNILKRLTKYYPFSLFYRSKLFHAENQSLVKLVNKIDTVSRQAKLPAYCLGWDSQGSLISLTYKFLNKPRVMGRAVKKLEKSLQKKFGTIYVRKIDKGKISILIPIDLL